MEARPPEPSSAARLSVVLPCRDQADHLEALLRRYLSVLGASVPDHELLVVPNACRDHTEAVARELAAAEPRVRVVPSPRAGWGLAVLTGLAAARGSILCYTNSARTDPAQIPRLLELYRAHSPCVAKARRGRRHVPLRDVGSWLYNLEARLLYRLPVRDVNGTPKMLPRELYERLALFSEGDLLDLELVVKASGQGMAFVEMPVEGFTRHGGRSRTGLRSAWKMYAGAWRLRPALSRFRSAGA
jgi:glycosyltransferase involved in cell wall biosynthesis